MIVGVGGGEYGIRGFIAAYDAATGKEAWRFNTIPAPGEPGSDTWSGDAWKNGGGSLWVTGTYDPALNLTYWGIGNPGPDFNPAQRPGDNLYTDSVVALDADTGTLQWHFQFTPNDRYDWDSTQVPVLVDANWNGAAGEAADARQSQRILLRARSSVRQVSVRQTVHQSELGERPRRERPADPDAAAAWRNDVARTAGRHELVFAVVQSAHRTLLHSDVGGRLRRLHEPAGPVPAGAELLGRELPRDAAGA